MIKLGNKGYSYETMSLVPGVHRVTGRFCQDNWVRDTCIITKAKMRKCIVQYLPLVGEIGHHIPVKLVLQGGPDSFYICNVIANAHTVSFPLHAG